MHATALLATASITASAVLAQGLYSTTATMPGMVMTLPVGIDESTTRTILAETVTGEAAIISGVTVIVNSVSVYFVDEFNTVTVGVSGTNAYNGITVINGNIQGLGGVVTASTTAPSGSGSTSKSYSDDEGVCTQKPTTTSTAAAATGTTMVSSPTTQPSNAGVRAFGSVQMLGCAGAAIGAIALANY